MEENKNPCALIVSCSLDKTSKDLVTEIIGVETPVMLLEDGIDMFIWKIHTKYYNANVNLCTPAHRTVPSAAFAEKVEAVLLHFNPENRDTFAAVQTWLRTVSDLYTCSVKLLTCERCQHSDAVTKEELDQFCIQHGLELIQLSPIEIDSDDEEFGSIHSISRVRAALQAHSWSNLELKAQPMRIPVDSSSDSDEPADLTETLDNGPPPVSDNEESGDINESFSNLFSRLHELRSTANTLSSEERKNFAEKVAKDFLRSLDVDPEELSD